jgi:hypothetical protein
VDDPVLGESERTAEPRHSSLRIDVTFSVGYTRVRAGIADRFEMRVSSIGLLLAGAIICLIILVLLVPHILSLLGSL